MMRAALISLLFLSFSFAIAQTTIDFNDVDNNKMYIRLYGQIDYNQKIEKGHRNSGNLDVHRIVTLFGYQFSRKTQFVTEIEFEHANEIFVEQAFIKHKISKSINLKAGLILIPMGFINENHEPTFFYTVERPLLDKIIIPSTWREIGIGITGLIQSSSLKYQLYLVNNPLGYSDGGKINGENGFRSARQKGAKSIITGLPGLSGQLEYFGLTNMKTGLSFYHGKCNTSLVDEFEGTINPQTDALIDSSTVTISMATLHSSYSFGRWTTRAQYTISAFSNSTEYNRFTSSDVPELMHGYYILASYDLLKDEAVSLSPFIRYSHLNNHLKVSDNIEKNQALQQNIISLGFNYKPEKGVVFKIDYQWYRLNNEQNYSQFNAGIGVWF